MANIVSLRITGIVTVLVSAVATACGDPTAPRPVSVTITPAAIEVDAGASTVLTAVVTNTSNAAVTWVASGGTVAAAGLSATYTAPFVGGVYTVVATSVADPQQKASVSITVRAIAVIVAPQASNDGRWRNVTIHRHERELARSSP